MIYQIIETKDFLLAVSESYPNKGDYAYYKGEIGRYYDMGGYFLLTVLDEDGNITNTHLTEAPVIHAYYPLSDKQLDLPLLPGWEEPFNKDLITDIECLWVELYDEDPPIPRRFIQGAYKLFLKEHNIKIYPKQFETEENMWEKGAPRMIPNDKGNFTLLGKYIF